MYKNINHLTPEIKLLLVCSKNKISEEEIIFAYDLINQIKDWNEFYILVKKNRLESQVMSKLKVLNTNVDKSVLHKEYESKLDKIEKKAKQNKLKSFLHLTDLISVINLLENNKIKYLSLKGPDLSYEIYEDISKRISKDLDIYIDSKDLDKLIEILNENNYQLIKKDANLTPKQKIKFMKQAHHLSFINNNKTLIEVHFRLSYKNFYVDFLSLFDKQSYIDILNKNIKIMSKEDNFLYLIFHGSKHCYKRIKWLIDILEIVEKDKLDWEYIYKKANEFNIIPQLVQTKLILEDLFYNENNNNLYNNKFVFIGKKDKKFRKGELLKKLALPVVLGDEEIPEKFGNKLSREYKIYMYNFDGGFYNKLFHLLNIFRPNLQDYQCYKISDRFYFLYYFLRPFRILKRIIFCKNKNKK